MLYFLSLYFINPTFNRIINFTLLLQSLIKFLHTPKLNGKITFVFGSLIIYGLFQTIFNDVGFYHYKNLLNLLGFLLIFSCTARTIGNISDIKLAIYVLSYAIIWVLILLTCNFLFFNLHVALNNLSVQNLNDYYLALNNNIGISLTQKQTLAQLFTVGFFASFCVKTRSLRIILMLLLFYFVLGSRSCTLGILVAMVAKSLPYSKNVNWALIFYITFIIAWFIVFNLIPENIRLALNFDVRFSFFSAAYLIFMDNPLLGVGLFNVADYMAVRNDYFLGLFGDLHEFNNRFGTGIESGMLQFLISGGLIGSFWIYLIGRQHRAYIKTNGWDWVSLSFLAIFVSSCFEDNLLFPIFYMILSLVILKAKSDV